MIEVAGRTRRWARRLSPVNVEVECGGQIHRVLLRRGKLVLEHHAIAAEAAAVALGAPSTECFEIYRSWRLRRQWETALQPRGPGFHQLYRRPPLPKPLADPLERGIIRSWERRAARGEDEVAEILQRAAWAKAEPALAASLSHAIARFEGGPPKRLELRIADLPEVTGAITPSESSLVVCVGRDWLRTVGLPRQALDGDCRFVVAAEPRLVVDWHPQGETGEASETGWTARLRTPAPTTR